MKTERRHELQHNVLADKLGTWMHRAAPYAKFAAWAALAAGLVLCGVGVWTYYKNREASVAWREYMDAMASADSHSALEDLAASRPNKTVGLWARLALADNALASGSQQIYRDRDEAERSLADAREDYEAVLEAAPRSPFLRQRAEFGLALAYEIAGELKNARTHYQNVVKLDEDTALAKEAQEQIKLLNDKEIRGFYDWFVAQRDVPRPQNGMGLEGLNNLPDSPNIDIESLLNQHRGGATPSDQPGSPAEGSEFDSSILNETLTAPDEAAEESTTPEETTTPEESTDTPPADGGDQPAGDGGADVDAEGAAESDATNQNLEGSTPPENVPPAQP